tara:strand:- start:77 stop:304 length:228 start_codon:yes stop_codon:yes gene_type:complete
MVATDQTVYRIRCELCDKEQAIIADKNDILAWMTGEKYIQDALSYLSAADREMFISKTCGDCWDKLYPNDVDDDE